MRKVAVVQSNYIPWKGYFDLIDSVDVFILFDTVQFTRRDWRNRNKIKTPQGLSWLTVPVEVKGRYHQPINEVVIAERDWAQKHWRSIEGSYRRAPFFDIEADWIEAVFRAAAQDDLLTSMNERFLRAICTRLGITTEILRCENFELLDDRSERLAHLCEQVGGDAYVSGPAARAYLEEAPFRQRDLSVEWFDYSGYREYAQLWGPFEHGVTVLDVIFNCGQDATEMIRAKRQR